VPRRLPGRQAGLATLVALAATSLAGAPARADAPAPGCAGTAFTDPTGDAVDASVPFVDQPGSPNLDVTGGFFLADAAGAVTANIQVANLTTDVPATATGVDWYMVWSDAAGAFDYVRASVEPGGEPVFSYGQVTVTPANTLYQDTAETTGQVFPGANGVVQIALPPEYATGTLQAPFAQTFEEQNISTPVVGLGNLADADRAPDDGGGQDYAVGGCTAGASAAAAGAPATSGPPPASSPRAGQAPGSSAPSSSDAPRPALRVTTRGASARSTNRSRALRVGVTSNVALSLVRGVLRDGRGRTVATGGLGRLERRGILRLRLRRALRPGRYTLRLTGRDAHGATAARTARITVAR
jgi:hypothetical protein